MISLLAAGMIIIRIQAEEVAARTKTDPRGKSQITTSRLRYRKPLSFPSKRPSWKKP